MRKVVVQFLKKKVENYVFFICSNGKLKFCHLFSLTYSIMQNPTLTTEVSILIR